MKVLVSFLVAVIICVASFFIGSNLKENEMHNQEIRNILLTQHQLLTSIRNSIDQGESNEYVKGQIITLQYSGLHFNQSHSDIKGFMEYCLVAINEQNINGLKDTINKAINITEAVRLDSKPSQIKSTLEEFNQFISSYTFPVN